MNKLILTDVDETVLDFTTPFESWVQAKGWSISGKMRDVYDLTKLLQTDLETAIGLVGEFHTDAPEFGLLEPEPCAKVVLPRLYERGYRFVAITACVDTPEVRETRLTNLKAAFGFEFEDCHCVGLRTDKAAVLERYGRSIWVEDNPKHANDGARLGHRSFLLPQGYNSTAVLDSGVIRVQNWHELEGLL